MSDEIDAELERSAKEFWRSFQQRWAGRISAVLYIAAFIAGVLLCVRAVVSTAHWVVTKWSDTPVEKTIVQKTTESPDDSMLPLVLRKHPTQADINAAAKFMAKRCHAELQMIPTRKDSLQFLNSERTFSSVWPEDIGVTNCFRWILLDAK